MGFRLRYGNVKIPPNRGIDNCAQKDHNKNMDTTSVCRKLAQALRAEPAREYEYIPDIAWVRSTIPQSPWAKYPTIRYWLNYEWRDVRFIVAQEVLAHRLRSASRLPL